MTRTVSLIVAMSENRVIGQKGKLPWSIPQDLKNFKTLTMSHPVVMGRKTYESIGRLLPGRTNIILTHQKDYRVSGARIVSSLPEALEGLCGEIFIIGGGEIYQQALPLVQKIYLTLVHIQAIGDSFFPEFEKSLCFKETWRETHLESSPPFSFLILEKL